MEEIINSVMQSPENTNPNVLRSQLQKIGEGSGNSTNAYVVEVNASGNIISGTFEEAKKCFQSEKKVVLMLTFPTYELGYRLTDYEKNVGDIAPDASRFTEGTKEVLYMPVTNESTGNRAIVYAFFSDNTITIRA